MNNQKSIFDEVCIECSRNTTKSYSTSFSWGIKMLGKKFRDPIYAIYGFVRFADEIVDTFHDYDKEVLINKFRQDTVEAIKYRISLNPILNSFQKIYHEYNIEWDLVDKFLLSMEMDLGNKAYDREGYENYIFGSAEVVGLMCLRVFTENNSAQYEELRPGAIRLGAAFQKINFLRDIKADFEGLGRTYFPGLDINNFDGVKKAQIELEIAEDFKEAYKAILLLPKEARLGVYLAYVYYTRLFKKIIALPSERILEERVRIPNQHKVALIMKSYVRHNLNML
jgi:15-cis-phytoene synthase